MAAVYTTVICDLGDVLFTWKPSLTTKISPSVLREILRTPSWFDFECKRVSDVDCYAAIGRSLGLDVQDVSDALQAARESLRPNTELLEFLKDIKATHGLQFVAMSNISASDFTYLRTTVQDADWALFDRVFTSADAGQRKPDLGFFRHVINATKLDPEKTIFIDDNADNILAGASVGLQAIQFIATESLRQEVLALLEDPLARGEAFLATHACKHVSYTSTGVELGDNFAQLLIFELTGKRDLVDFEACTGKYNFFRGGVGKLTTTDYPCDLDATAIALTLLPSTPDIIRGVMDEMLEFRTLDDILQVYFDSTWPRIDPVVCCNVLTFFYTHGRGHEVQPTLRWVHDVLASGAYLHGTRYYPTPEAFLYFAVKLWQRLDVDTQRVWLPLLRKHIQARIGTVGDALVLAMRVSAGATLGIVDDIDGERLRALQCTDGSWPADCWLYKYGSKGVFIANTGLTTAYAVSALRALAALPLHAHHCGIERRFPTLIPTPVAKHKAQANFETIGGLLVQA